MFNTYIYIMVTISTTYYSWTKTNLVKVAVNVASKDLDPRKETIVVWRNESDIVNSFLRNFNGPVISVDLNKKEINKQYEQYVSFVATVDEHDDFFKMMKLDLVTPVKVIVILLEDCIDIEDLQKITKNSFVMNITNLAIIHKGDEDVKITMSFPKTEGNCENHYPVTFNASDVTDCFPSKFKNFFKCPLRVSFLDLPPYVIPKRDNGRVVSVTGTDGRLVQIIAQKLNASVTAVFAEDFGHFTSNGRWTGTMGDLMSGRADISATSAVTNLDRFQAVQLTHSYKIMSINWCAPIRVETQAWAKVLLPLLRNSTLVFGTACLMLVATCAWIQKWQLPRSSGKLTLFHSCAIFLGQFVKFESGSWLLNSLFLLWVWVCLILRIAFQGDLVKNLEMTIIEPPFKTFAEAHKQIESYGGVDSLVVFYKDSLVAENYQQLTLAEVKEKAVSISQGERFLLAVDLWTLRHLGVRVQILGEPAITSPVSILVRPRWAAAKEFDSILLRIVESGIYDKITEDYNNQDMLKNYRKYPTHDLHFTPLDWLHLSGCFYVFLIECALCFFLFCLEIVWFKCTRKT